MSRRSTQNAFSARGLPVSIPAVTVPAPSLSGFAAAYTVQIGALFQLNAAALNVGGQADAWAFVGEPAGWTVNNNGLVTWSGNGTAGTTSGVQLTATNATGSSTVTFDVVVETAPVLGNWQRPVGAFQPAVQDMVVESPRPVAESDSNEPNRLWPSGKAYRYAINVRGGARHHQYVITAGPAEAAIGEQYGSPDYGVLTLPDTMPLGTYNITVRIRSQEFGRNTSGFTDEVSVDIALVIADRNNTSLFQWTSGTGNDANSGSFDSPKRQPATILETPALSGRQIHMLPGTYNTDGAAQLVLGDSTCKTLVGTFNRDAIIDYTQRNFAPSDDGATLMGFDVITGPTYGNTVNNLRGFTFGPNADRFKCFEVFSTNPVNGTVGNDNPTLLYANNAGPSNIRRHWAISHCSEIGRSGVNNGNAGCLYILFRVDEGVAEFNYIDGLSGTNGDAALKDSNRDWTVSDNISDNPNTSRAFSTICQLGSNSSQTERIEVCYNKSAARFRFNAMQDPCGVHWIYRNSTPEELRTLGPNDADKGPYIVYANAVGGFVSSGSRVQLSLTELHSAGANILDANLSLQNQARTDWLTLRGADVLGDP